MHHIQGWFSGSQGLELYYQRWQPQGDPKGSVALVHGLGSHSAWFVNLISPLVESGYCVYAYDLRGHGRSPGQQGHIDHWAQYRDDFHHFYQLIRAHQPTLPCFVLGHSLGGIIVLDYALHYPGALSGVIIIAPAIGNVGVPTLKLALGRLLSWICPRFSLDTGLDRQGGSRDPAIVKAYELDPLRHTRGTARLATEFLRTRQWLSDRLCQLTMPMLVLQGGGDPVVSPDSVRQMFDHIQTTDKEYHEYPDAYHDLHNDRCAAIVVQDILDWLERHTQTDSRFCFVQLVKSSYAAL